MGIHSCLTQPGTVMERNYGDPEITSSHLVFCYISISYLRRMCIQDHLSRFQLVKELRPFFLKKKDPFSPERTFLQALMYLRNPMNIDS